MATPVIMEMVSQTFLAAGFGSAGLALEVCAEAASGSDSSPVSTSRKKILFMQIIICPTTAGCKAQSNKLKSRVDFNRAFDIFHVPLYWNLDENAFAES